MRRRRPYVGDLPETTTRPRTSRNRFLPSRVHRRIIQLIVHEIYRRRMAKTFSGKRVVRDGTISFAVPFGSSFVLET